MIAREIVEAGPEENPQVHFAALRKWVQEHCAEGNVVRESALNMARSAVVHRLLKFGPDETLNTMSARELMCLLVYVNGTMAEYLMRVIYIRSIVEGDHAVYEQFNQTLFIPDLRAWYWQIAEAVMGKAVDPGMVTAWLEEMQGEELSVARLIIARVYPDVTQAGWLEDVPANVPRLAAELCRLLLSNPRNKPVVEMYLENHPEVMYSLPPGP